MIAKIISRPRKDYPLTVQFERLEQVDIGPVHDNSIGTSVAYQSMLGSTLFYNRATDPYYSTCRNISSFPNINYPDINFSVTPYAQSLPYAGYFDAHSFQKKVVRARVLNAEMLYIGWRLMNLKRKKKFCLLWRGRPCEIEDLGKDVVKIIKLY